MAQPLGFPAQTYLLYLLVAIVGTDPGWTVMEDLSHSHLPTSLQEEAGVKLGSQGPHSLSCYLSLGPQSQEFHNVLNCFLLLFCIL